MGPRIDDYGSKSDLYLSFVHKQPGRDEGQKFLLLPRLSADPSPCSFT